MSTKTATQYADAIARVNTAAGNKDRKWNQRYIAALEAEGLTLSLVTRRGPQYPGNISAAAAATYGAGPIRWSPPGKVYVVWSEDLI